MAKRKKDRPSNSDIAKMVVEHLRRGEFAKAEYHATDLMYRLRPANRYQDYNAEERQRLLLSIQSRPVERDFALQSLKHLLDEFLVGLQKRGRRDEAEIIYGIRNTILYSTCSVSDLRFVEAQVQAYSKPELQ